MAHKEVEKIDQYERLLIEIQRLWHVKADVNPTVIGALGALTHKFVETTGCL